MAVYVDFTGFCVCFFAVIDVFSTICAYNSVPLNTFVKTQSAL